MTLPQPQIRINLFKNFPRAAAPTAPESLVAALSPAGQAHQLPPAQPARAHPRAPADAAPRRAADATPLRAGPPCTLSRQAHA